MNKFKPFIFSFLCIWTSSISGQGIPTGVPPGAMQDSTFEANIPDTTILEYFHLTDIKKKYVVSDTGLNRFFHEFDPTKSRNEEYFNLGNTGSAATPIIYNKNIVMGTDYGYHTYDPYNLNILNFKYYHVNRPYFDFKFTPVGGQENFVIKADFARSFSDGVKLSINYNRINQVGFYDSQDVKHTNFGAGIWYQHPKKKQELFFTFINAVNTENHNGGINNENDLYGQFSSDRMSIATNINSAATRFQHRRYDVRHIYRLQDSLGNNMGWEVHSSLSLKNGYYKFADDMVSSEQSYYENFYQDNRGIRQYLGYTEWQTEHELKGNLISDLQGSVGISFTHRRINLEAQNLTKNDLFLLANLNLPLFDKLQLDAITMIGLGSSSGDLLISGQTNLNLLKGTDLYLKFDFYRNRHPLLANSLFINENPIWENNFPKPFGTKIQGNVELPWLDANIGIQQVVENNSLYWTEDVLPAISSDIFTATKLNASFTLSLWNFYLNNYVAGQVFSTNLYNLPKYYTKHNLYWTGKLFQERMELKIGLDGRLIGDHNMINFNPVLSIFHQSEGQSDVYPFANVYLTAKIQNFRFFLRYENIGSHMNNQVYFQIGQYPQYDRKIRLGISWQFLD